MIIGACGFGGTGSSSITDYLAEYDFMQVMGPTEFTWVSLPDGIIDLEYHLKHPHGRYADSYKAIERYVQRCKNEAYVIKRFGIDYNSYISSINSFIDSITQAEWTTPYDLEPCTSFFEKVYRKLLLRSNCILKWEK